MGLLGDIEEHLGVTINQVDPDLKVPLDEFDGKVTYGQKKKDTGRCYLFFCWCNPLPNPLRRIERPIREFLTTLLLIFVPISNPRSYTFGVRGGLLACGIFLKIDFGR